MAWQRALLALLLATPAFAQQTVLDQQRADAINRVRIATVLVGQEEWDAAAREFQSAVATDPLNTDAYVGLGRAHMGAQRYQAAAEAFAQAIEAARRIHASHIAQPFGGAARTEDELSALREELARLGQLQDSGGFTTAQHCARLQSRIRELERQKDVSLVPFQPSADVLLMLGTAQLRTGQFEAAEKSWIEAARVNDRLGEAWNNLAILYHAAGRRSDAQNALLRAERAGFQVNPRLKDDIKAMK